jgi:hypothetical protein
LQVMHTSVVAISMIGLISLFGATQAAPLSSPAVRLKADPTVSSGVEKAAYRVCWLKHGIYPKCTWYQDPSYYYYDRYDYYDYRPHRHCWLKHGIYPKCRWY